MALVKRDLGAKRGYAKITVRWVAWRVGGHGLQKAHDALHAGVRDSSAQQAHLQLAALPPAVSAVVRATW